MIEKGRMVNGGREGKREGREGEGGKMEEGEKRRRK